MFGPLARPRKHEELGMRAQPHPYGEVINDFDSLGALVVVVPVRRISEPNSWIHDRPIGESHVVGVRLLAVVPNDVSAKMERDLALVFGDIPLLG